MIGIVVVVIIYYLHTILYISTIAIDFDFLIDK